MARSDELTLTVDGKALTGWVEAQVQVGIEQMPNTFQVLATDRNPSLADASGVKEGAVCTVSLGGDQVISGYVDTIVPYFQVGAHGVRLQGRGKCQDLVDCSAEWPRSQISGANAVEIATKLAKPYGISVKALSSPGPVVPQFNINVTDTPADVLEMITRHAGLLYYEGFEGDLVLAEVAADDMASGFVEGENVQAASVVKSVAARYSNYKCSLLSVDTSGLFQYSDGLFYFEAKDPFVTRHRQLVLVAEGVTGGRELAETRALWEASRRAGRGRAVNVTVDGWRDAGGRLWTPNTLAPVELPTLGLSGAVYCISAVVFKMDLQGGRTADVTLMPRESFLPAPIKLQPLVGGVVGPNGERLAG